MTTCARCEGKGKSVLFSSVEDPCRDCKGTGVLQPSASGPTPTTKDTDRLNNHLDLMQSFFKEEFGRLLSPAEVCGKYLLNKRAPTQKDVDHILILFTTKYGRKTAGTSNIMLSRLSKPRWYYRRPSGDSLPFKLKPPFHSSWNRPSTSKQPYSSLVLLSDPTVAMAAYLMWDL